MSESSQRDEVDKSDDVEDIDEREQLENASDFNDSVSEFKFWSSSVIGLFLRLVNFYGNFKKFCVNREFFINYNLLACI